MTVKSLYNGVRARNNMYRYFPFTMEFNGKKVTYGCLYATAIGDPAYGGCFVLSKTLDKRSDFVAAVEEVTSDIVNEDIGLLRTSTKFFKTIDIETSTPRDLKLHAAASSYLKELGIKYPSVYLEFDYVG